MAKFEGINKNYSPNKDQTKSSQKERDRLMQEFLAKGGKIEKVKSRITKQLLEKGKY